MEGERIQSSGVALKALIAALAALAVAIGLALPVPHKGHADQPMTSQFTTLELDAG